LLCAFLVDHQVGQSWVVTAAVRRGLRRALAGKPEEVVDAAFDASDARSNPMVRAEAQLALAAACEEMDDRGETPTLEALARLKPAEFRAWLAERSRQGMARSSTARAFSSVRSFFRFLDKNKLAHNASIATIQTPKLPRSVPKALSGTSPPNPNSAALRR
jgi:integrase